MSKMAGAIRMSGTVLTTNSADPAANNDSTLSSLISTRMSALSIWFEMLSGKDGELIYDLSSDLKKSFHIKHKKNSFGEESYRRFPLPTGNVKGCLFTSL